ncbi:MAG: hypothetical protein GX767_06705 [Firmicutes bacterium]|nr:hypothetical protein [Bacillota bacterium]
MLKEILRIIGREGYISRPKLAAELNISKVLVDDGISQLLRMGYILEDKNGEGCSSFCSSCSRAKACSKEVVKTFKISEKGQRLLQASS